MLLPCGIIDTADSLIQKCVSQLFSSNHSFPRSRHLIHTHRQEMHRHQPSPLVILLPRLSPLMCEQSCDIAECCNGVYVTGQN